MCLTTANLKTEATLWGRLWYGLIWMLPLFIIKQPSVGVGGAKLVARTYGAGFVIKGGGYHTVELAGFVQHNLGAVSFALERILQTFGISLEAEAAANDTECLQTGTAHYNDLFDACVAGVNRLGRGYGRNRRIP